MKNGYNKFMASKTRQNQAGNAIVFLFAAIAMAGTVTYGLNNIMRGPAMTTNEVSRKTIAENNLIATSRLAVVAASTQQADGGDCDGDGFVEPLPYRDPGALPRPVGGGLIPMTMGASVSDPWGTQYGYCVWDPGTVSVSNAVPACGGATPRRLQGAPRDDQYAITIISAGKNGAFETSCNGFVDTTPADGKPDTALVVKPAASDDIVLSYTYAEANGIGGGVWKLKDGDATTAVVGKNVEVAGGATFNDGPLTLQNKGLVLPGDPGDDTVTGPCDEAKDQQLRRNIGDGTPLPVIEICDYAGGNGWTQVGGGANPPVPPTQEIAEILADTPTANDRLGYSVNISGNLAIVGAPGDDDGAANSGSAYIYTRSGGAWSLTQKITASDPGADDGFGSSVAISGEFAIVGAHLDDDGATNAGSAYIFVNSGGTWTQVQKIVASDPNTNDSFGTYVTITATMAVVGAYSDDAGGTDSGAAYIFNRSGGTWVQTQKLMPSDAAANKHFAWNFDVSGNFLIIGAWQDTHAGVNSGAAYIFQKSGATWTQTQKLTASDAAANNFFGVKVAIDGSTAVVGAHTHAGRGAAYVFTNSGGTWTESQKLMASDALAGDGFGVSLDISENLLAIGAHQNDDKGNSSGSAYIFSRVGTAWTEVANVTASDGAADDVFGRYLSLSGDTMLVGAYQHDHGASDTGAAYIFSAPGTSQTVAETVRTKLTDSLDQGLVAHWKMDEGSGTTVRDSVGGYHGTFINTPVWTSGVNGASALSFSMADRDAVAIPSLSGAYTPSAGTIAAWVNINSSGVSGSEVFTTGHIVLRVIPDGRVMMAAHYTAGNNFRAALSLTPLPKGWNYLVGTFDDANDRIRIFANGVLVGENVFNEAPYYDPPGSAYIGRHTGQTDYDFNGGIDNIRLYNRALGSSEVAELSYRAQHESRTQRSMGVTPPGDLVGKLSVGAYHTCGIKNDGTAWCWGLGTSGRLGNGLTSDRESPSMVLDVGPWTSISAGNLHTCGIKANGSLWCWGDGSTGTLGNGVSVGSAVPLPISEPGPWTSVAAGHSSTCALKNDGTAWCWGVGNSGQLGNGSGTHSLVPVQVTSTMAWKSLASGGIFNCGLKIDGSAWCWGNGINGRLGNGGTSNQSSPVAVAGNKTWSSIWASSHTGDNACGIEMSGEAWCWGLGSFGRLGNGAATDSSVPVKVVGGGLWSSITVGDAQTCGVQIDGSPWCWGLNSVNGILGIGLANTTGYTTPQRVLLSSAVNTIGAGAFHICSALVDGRLFCSGMDTNGQLGNGSSVTSAQFSPYPVLNFPGISPWSWDETFTNILLQGGINLGLNGYWMSDDGTENKYFGFQSAGRGTLRQRTGSHQLLIDTTATTSSSQVTFRAGNQDTPSVDYRPATLRAEWLFDETSGTAAPSETGAHNGTLQGTPVWNPTGSPFGTYGALEFKSTGLDRVRVANHANLRPASLSITTLVKPAGIQMPGTILMSKTHTSQTGTPGQSYGLRFEEGGGISFVTGTAGALDVLGPVPIRPDAWTHITAVFVPDVSAAYKFLYINGKLVASKTTAVTIAYDATAAGDLFLGAGGCASLPCNNFVGAISATRIYGGTLTADQVYQIYKFQTSGLLPQTLGLDHGTNAIEIGRNNAAATNLISGISPDVFINSTGWTAIGSTATSSRLNVNGGVRVGHQPVCNAAAAGTIRNDLGSHYECTNNHNNFIPRETTRAWRYIASSADGTKLAATVFGGQIYTSTDSGVTWVPRDANRDWMGIASSADGTKLAAVSHAGKIYTSTDSGVTWVPRDANRVWRNITSSSDGAKLAATVGGGQIYTSTDSGVTWVPRDANRDWIGIASSADGTKLAALAYAGQIYTSTDSGVTWVPRDANRNWRTIASSADGTKLLAAVEMGQLYTSINSGATWTPRDANRNWLDVTVSADGTKQAATVNAGQIYTSINSGANWTPRESGGRGWWGVASSADGTKLAVAVNAGQIYTSNTCAWKTGFSAPRQTAMLVPNDPQASRFGSTSTSTTAISGNTVIVGDILADTFGAAYVFEYDGGTWTQAQKIVPGDVAAADRFGTVSNISGDTIMIGSSQDDEGAANSGSVYVFTKSGGTWVQTQKFTASDPTLGKLFGFTIVLGENIAVIGAYGENTSRGSAYIFQKENGMWTQTQKLTAPDGASNDIFSQYIAMSKDVIAIGAWDNGGMGAAYIFEKSGATWTQVQKIRGTDTVAGDVFGKGMVIADNGDIIVGAQEHNTTYGAAYVFRKIGGTWTQVQKLTASDGSNNDLFGGEIYGYNDTIVVAALRDDDVGTDVGGAYIFKRINNSWVQIEKFTANTGTASDQLGKSLNIDKNRILLGSFFADTVNGADRGAVYVFEGVGVDQNPANAYKYCDGTDWKEFSLLAGTPFKAARGGQYFDAGRGNTCAVMRDGSAWCWGWGSDGVLGDGTLITSSIPVAVKSPVKWNSVTVGHLHACGIAADGLAWCWGQNTNGALGDGTNTARSTPTLVNDAGPWVHLKAGTSTCGIKSDGTAWCWGSGNHGRLGTGSGTNYSSPYLVSGGGRWIDIDTGFNHTCGIKDDSTVWCWGRGTEGQMGNGTTTAVNLNPVQVSTIGWTTKISVGHEHSCGIRTNGAALCWGRGSEGQMGNGTTTAVNSTPVQVSGGGRWIDITTSEMTGAAPADSFHSCGIKSDGTAWCWGRGTEGQMGNGTTTAVNSTPVQVNGTGWVAIDASPTGVCATKEDGTMWCWGQGSSITSMISGPTPQLRTF